MKRFLWQGKDKNNNVISGELFANNKEQLLAILKQREITAFFDAIKKKEHRLLFKFKVKNVFSRKINNKNLFLIIRKLSTLISAGVPIIKSIEIICNQCEDEKLKGILDDVRCNIKEGNSLSNSFRKYEDLFDSFFIQMLKVGEESGTIDKVLERVCLIYEKNLKTKQEVKIALIYPACVLSISILVTMCLLFFVIPSFSEIFNDFGATLPPLTSFVINLSNFLVSNIILIVAIFSLIISLTVRYYKTQNGKLFFDKLFFSFPYFGNLTKKFSTTRFSRAFGIMISSGVPIMNAIETCSKIISNRFIKEKILNTKNRIKEGQKISESLKIEKIFPQMALEMINVGEASGALDEMLFKVSDFYDEELENYIKTVKELLEPIMILVLGTIIGFLVISMYLPVFQLGKVIN